MEQTSGTHTSLWLETAAVPQSQPLQSDATADVCVIGAGISGLSTAYLLAREGRYYDLFMEQYGRIRFTGRTADAIETFEVVRYITIGELGQHQLH